MFWFRFVLQNPTSFHFKRIGDFALIFIFNFFLIYVYFCNISKKKIELNLVIIALNDSLWLPNIYLPKIDLKLSFTLRNLMEIRFIPPPFFCCWYILSTDQPRTIRKFWLWSFLEAAFLFVHIPFYYYLNQFRAGRN